MDKADIVQLSITVVTFLLPWRSPDASSETKWIYAMLVVILSLIVFVLRQTKQIKYMKSKLDESRKELAETQSKHKALAKLFDKKSAKLRRYQDEFQLFRITLLVATTIPKEAKLKLLHDAFAEAESRLNDEGD